VAADDDLGLVAVGVLDELLIAQAVRVQRRLRDEPVHGRDAQQARDEDLHADDEKVPG
jgi:hypothetical protein